MAIPRDQRWRMGGCLAVRLVYRKLLYEEASQPVVELSSMETDEEREGAFLLSAISCDCGLRLIGTCMHHYIHQSGRMRLPCRSNSYPAM